MSSINTPNILLSKTNESGSKIYTPSINIPSRFHTPWENAPPLHVIIVYTNPLRLRSRKALFLDCAEHLAASAGVVLHKVELAYGDRPFEVTGINDLQLRTNHELWHKENLGNLGVRTFPPDWEYGALIDGDFHMTRHNWALEAIHQLQHHPWVQLYSSLAYLGPDHRPHRLLSSFGWNWLNNNKMCSAENESPGAVGGAWAFTRPGFDSTGGFLETCIMGSGDWHMAFGLVGRSSGHRELETTPAAYGDSIRAWQSRASSIGDIGCIDNHAVHHWHGTLRNRGYGSRINILINNAFDPNIDIYRDSQGVLMLSGNKPKLRDDIRQYFRSRNEDSLEANEVPLC